MRDKQKTKAAAMGHVTELEASSTSSSSGRAFVDISTPARARPVTMAEISGTNTVVGHAQRTHHARGQGHGKQEMMGGASFVSAADLAADRRQHSGRGNSRRGNCRTKGKRRANVHAMLRSSIMSDRISNLSAATKPSFQGSTGSKARERPSNVPVLTTVPMLGDCNFDQTYPIVFSQDEAEMTPIGKLRALRDVMGSMSDTSGYIDRQTFSDTFELGDDEFNGYDDDQGMIDGKALLIDAVMELDVGAEEKLQFIFDTVDVNRIGQITEEQVVDLLTSNFASVKLEVVGTELESVAKLLFRKAGALHGVMTYDQFRIVFHSYVGAAEDLKSQDKRKASVHVQPVKHKSTFQAWYETNGLRMWWLLLYLAANNAAFWIKWFMYDVDPALGYGLRIARACAQVAMLNCVFVLLPMCRSITQVMKRSRLMWRYIPFDDHIGFHKICGTVLLTAGLIHTLAHVSNELHLYLWATPKEISRSIFIKRHVPGFVGGTPPPFIIMLQSLPVWTGVILLVITLISFPLAAIPKFRQGKFNLFWYSHMLFGPFLLVLCFHGAASWLARSSSYMWITPPFLIYLVERRFRYAKMFAAPVRIMEAVELDKTCAIFMEKPRRFVYRPGMYLFINCPAISSHEWHPFTISSAPGDNYLSIHVRNAGDWTGALHALIADCHKNQKNYPHVYLDGPVGAPTQDYHRYRTVMCIAGGIGVTPFASILKDVVHLWEEYRCLNCSHVRHPSSFKLQKLYFHWTTRAQESLGWFEDTMNQITNMDRDGIIETHQYLTTVKESETSSQLKMFQHFVHEQTGHDFVSGLKTSQLTHFGRPDWDEIFQAMRQKHPGEEIGVFFCGPHALDKVLGDICLKYSSTEADGTCFDYHSEKFA